MDYECAFFEKGKTVIAIIRTGWAVIGDRRMPNTIPAGIVRVLNRNDAPALDELRLREYLTAREFEMTHPEHLRWSSLDDKGAIIGVVSSAGELLSTLRGLVVSDRYGAEDVFECTVNLPASLFPALLFGRGATSTSVRGMGLNALLRLHFLQAATSEEGGKSVKSSLALPYQGAPRVELMKKLGYELQRPEQTWDSEARERAPALLAILRCEQFTTAREYLLGLARDNMSRFPWLGQRLQLPPPLS
jgi:hypothetical protein